MMVLDSQQQELEKTLQKFIASVPISFKDKVLEFFKPSKDGLYIYGGVGRGKTMLVKRVLAECTIPHKVTHFQQFMQDVHKSIHELRKKTLTTFVLHKFVESYSKNIKLLFIDELEVKDIADAMILQSLILEFIEQDTKIIFTSNTTPCNLYLGGMQREFFIPFIEMIEENFVNFHLDNPTDYRTIKIAAIDRRMFFGKNATNINYVIEKLSKNEIIELGKVMLYGREVVFKQTINSTLITDFVELFERNLSSADYIEICNSFEIIIVKNIRKIHEDETDIAIRLINFIDNAYLQHVTLFCSFQDEITKIYSHGKRAQEFKRTISRLQEMDSAEYTNKHL
jgi:cell division protein ZapE